MKKTKTERAFRLYTFEDVYNAPCSLQESSNAEHRQVWLGMDVNEMPIHPKLNVSLGTRMLLDRKLAKKIALKLLVFAETGEI